MTGAKYAAIKHDPAALAAYRKQRREYMRTWRNNGNSCIFVQITCGLDPTDKRKIKRRRAEVMARMVAIQDGWRR